MRILLTDLLFPSKYAKWRLVQIFSFIENYDTDILVIEKINEFMGIKYEFDIEFCKKHCNKLQDYNILIFNPKYNHLNKYNTNFDGTVFNNKFSIDYLLRNKKHGYDDLSNTKYNYIYHIFLKNYENFNKIFRFNFSKQILWASPGGGITWDENCINNVNNDVKVIVNYQHIENYFKNKNKNNKILNLKATTHMFKNEQIIKKSDLFKDKLVVCFTGIGLLEDKGANKYIELVNYYNEKYKDKYPIKFISVGNCPDHENITHYNLMDELELEYFYNKNVDIYLNLDRGIMLNGFPLGIESIISGCLLLTTDNLNHNNVSEYYFDIFLIIKTIEETMEKIIYLYNNKDIYQKLIDHQQNIIYNKCKYENTMQRIFDFIINK